VYYFFSKRKESPGSATIAHALRTMALQLSQKNHAYKRYLQGLEKHTATNTVPGLWQKMFVDYFDIPGRSLLMVIDDVDEITDDAGVAYSQLMKLMSDLIVSKNPKILYILSNPCTQRDTTRGRAYLFCFSVDRILHDQSMD
jgi:hypothetical protein